MRFVRLFYCLLHSTGRASQQSDGTSPVALDILYRMHEVLLIPLLVHNYYNTSRPPDSSNSYPILSRKSDGASCLLSLHGATSHTLLQLPLHGSGEIECCRDKGDVAGRGNQSLHYIEVMDT